MIPPPSPFLFLGNDLEHMLERTSQDTEQGVGAWATVVTWAWWLEGLPGAEGLGTWQVGLIE